jgi:hypothetical protein
MMMISNGRNRWPKTDDPDILPPQYKRGPGRPKKMRRRDPDEADPLRWTRSNTTHQCQRCLEYGHNARTCKLPAPKKKNDVADKNVASASNGNNIFCILI